MSSDPTFQIINQMPFPVEVCDAQGKTTLVNRAFLDTFETPPAGRIIARLEKEGLTPTLREVYDRKKSAVVDLHMDPGEVVPSYDAHGAGVLLFEVTLFPVLSPHGEVQHAVALWRDVTERKGAEARMRSSLQEKELLVKEIHHRVKNNLQVVSSLLSLQGNSIREPEVRRRFEETRDRVRSMASIHEMLYQSADMARIDFSDYIDRLASQLYRSYDVDPERVKLRLEVDPVSLGINLGIPCGLLINELLTNALRHAFPGGRAGSIVVSMRETRDHSIRLLVRDDGIGIPSDIVVENSNSLGFQLITMLAGQLNGSLEVRREGGTEFVVVF